MWPTPQPEPDSDELTPAAVAAYAVLTNYHATLERIVGAKRLADSVFAKRDKASLEDYHMNSIRDLRYYSEPGFRANPKGMLYQAVFEDSGVENFWSFKYLARMRYTKVLNKKGKYKDKVFTAVPNTLVAEEINRRVILVNDVAIHVSRALFVYECSACFGHKLIPASYSVYH